jgi:hypothetical protein
MKTLWIVPRLDGLSHRADLWLLSALLGLGIPVARAQVSVYVNVETFHGAVVSGAKVTATKCLDPTSSAEKCLEPPNDKKVIEVLEEKETGKYSADRLRKGSYVLSACAEDVKYEPEVSDPFQLGDKDKKIPILVLKDGLKTVSIPGFAKGAQVCVIHRVTGCRAIREVDSKGKITIRGFSEDYEFESQESCK